MTDELLEAMRRGEYGGDPSGLYSAAKSRTRQDDDEDGEEDPNLYDLIRGSRRDYQRLRIIRTDSSAFSVFHDDIHTLEMTADGTKLTLCIKGGLLVTLTGERLTVLADYLEECRIRKIYAYDPKKHRFKPDISKDRIPVIHDIKEETPPLRKGGA